MLVAQTLAEKAGWDLAKKHGFELVTVNPVFVFGPVLSSRADATSILMMKVLPYLLSSCCLQEHLPLCHCQWAFAAVADLR